MLRSREHPPSKLRRTTEVTYIGNADIGIGVLASAILRLRSLLCAAFCSSSKGGGIADNKKAEAKASAVPVVAPTGFEPATFALRGRRPKPLDDGAIKKAAKHVAWVKLGSSDRIRTGDLRLERATS